ncbi:MAG: methyltransferase domain-containing protein [Deltaproteobacteria bacterium]|nr:methyltransferase domain-containing protein [Deltaproteobacteria bacterium]
MDASMRQKVALTAAHLLCVGRVADMGMGSGTGSLALAQLHPDLQVIGVDLDPTSVARARELHRLPNLSFEIGDIAQEVFREGSLDGVLDSSVLHHVTSYGGYRYEAAERALAVQTRALRVHGTLVVRDFVAPEPGEVLLDVPTDDGDDSDDPRRCSTARLLERVSRELRVLSTERGFPLQRVGAAGARARYRLSHRDAVEFVLRKDYRTDWESEIKEEYCYFTQREFEECLARLGMRVLASTPIVNPWIVKNRFEGRIALSDLEGRPLPWPATNTLVVGEKVAPGEGVRFRERPVRAGRAGETAPSLGFLEMTCYRDRRDGHVRDLVRRPHQTIDVVPFFAASGDLFVVARMSYPRPILAAEGVSIDGARPPHYVTEPLNVLQTDRSLGETVERMLESHAAIAPAQIRGFFAGATYYPSPGGTQEEVRSVLVEIDPVLVREAVPNVSGFSTSGRVRAIEAEQVLRAAQVGGLPDARLELAVYDLLLDRGRAPGPWLGEELLLREAESIGAIVDLGALRARPRRRVFERVDLAESKGFLELRCRRFDELDAHGEVVCSAPLEYVVPATRAAASVACALLARRGDQILLGVHDDDLPAAQCFLGNSQLLVAPAWRLPRDARDVLDARRFVLERLTAEFDVTASAVWDLGGRYHPSGGLSPEVVHPLAIEVSREGPAGRALAWIPLASVADHRDELLDGHLRIVALRAAHALGVLSRRLESCPPT